MWMKKVLVNNLLRRQLHCSGQNVDMPVEGRLGGGGEDFLESCLTWDLDLATRKYRSGMEITLQ